MRAACATPVGPAGGERVSEPSPATTTLTLLARGSEPSPCPFLPGALFEVLAFEDIKVIAVFKRIAAVLTSPGPTSTQGP